MKTDFISFFLFSFAGGHPLKFPAKDPTLFEMLHKFHHPFAMVAVSRPNATEKRSKERAEPSALENLAEVKELGKAAQAESLERPAEAKLFRKRRRIEEPGLKENLRNSFKCLLIDAFLDPYFRGQKVCLFAPSA